jgi:hypothetical protein
VPLAHTPRVRVRVSHIAHKCVRDPDFLYAALAVVAYAAFFKESRTKFAGPNRPNRKSGGMGHPLVLGQDRIYHDSTPKSTLLILKIKCFP